MDRNNRISGMGESNKYKYLLAKLHLLLDTIHETHLHDDPAAVGSTEYPVIARR
jgi:hypothetical protein